MIITIVSLNLWNINEPLDKRLSNITAGLNSLRADIICFQEVSVEPKSLKMQSQLIAEQCKYKYHIYEKSGEWKGREEGLAILSQFPILNSVQRILPEAPNDMPRQLLLAELSVHSKRIFLGNTHLAYRLDASEHRAKQVTEILSILDAQIEQPESPLIVCGDFNDIPSSKPVRYITESEINLIDVFNNDSVTDKLSFSKDNPYADPKLGTERWIDYVFATNDFKVIKRKLIFDGSNDLHLASDHYGLYCQFKLDL